MIPAGPPSFYVARPDAEGRATVAPADPEFVRRPGGLEVGEIGLAAPSSPDGVALDVGVGPGRARSFLSRMPAGYASGLHRTDTLDVSVVLSGRLEFAVASGRVPLFAGDCVLVLGVVHAWRALDDSVIAVTMTGLNSGSNAG